MSSHADATVDFLLLDGRWRISLDLKAAHVIEVVEYHFGALELGQVRHVLGRVTWARTE